MYVAQFIIFRRLRKSKKDWGFVFNSETDERVKGAFVRVYDIKNSRQIEVVITDEMGRYVFNKLPAGEYLISVYADEYVFPSKTEKSNVVKAPTNENFIKTKIKKDEQISIAIPSKDSVPRSFLN